MITSGPATTNENIWADRFKIKIINGKNNDQNNHSLGIKLLDWP